MWSAFPHSSLEFDLPARTAENYRALVPRGTAERAVFKADTQEGRGARVDLCGKQRGAPGAEWEEPRDAAGEAEEPRGAVNFRVVSLLSKTPPRRIKTEWNRAHSKEQQRTFERGDQV